MSLRSRVKKYTPATEHETTCRTCRKVYKTRSYKNQCRDCWRKFNGPKKKTRKARARAPS